MMGDPDPRAEQLRASLDALASGDLARWVPLDPDTSLDALAVVLDPMPPSVDAWLFHQPAHRLVSAGTDSAPHGITIWLQGGNLALVEVGDLRPARPVLDMVGAPVETLDSGLGSNLEQWPYPERGLTLHLDPTSQTIRRLFGFETISLEAFKESPLRHTYVDRKRRR